MTSTKPSPAPLPDSFTTAPTVVLGGTGKTGARVAERLRAAGSPVRPVGRRTPIPFDWADRDTWDAAIAGSERAYVAYAPDLAVPGALDDVRALTDRLITGGVQRIVLLSGRGEPEAADAEDIVIASGVEWGVVRCSWFFQNFTESYLRDPLVQGALHLPAGGVSEPFVDVDDVADVAAATLMDASLTGRVHELTGPELLTFGQITEIVARCTGRTIDYIPVSAEEYAQAALAEGVPAEVVTLLRYLFGVVLDGRNESVTDGVERALGRAPRSFESFAAASAAAGLWK
ncbi:NmrA family transcriptional regulator [Microbacterium sp. EST19A]|uniref:NmrA family transcriptional regulator n=1 Tax=Microbacterium sp. EST19A TaxID=2862681 RepID=UPI001CBD1D21|nr:NmrA family transcriptional regulator [Microbacterium sp. EST19A]